MKQTLLLAVLASTVLAGCASQHKLTQPSGRWQAVNQAGFVPANAERFYKGVMQQAVQEATSETAAPAPVEPAPAEQTEQVAETVQTADQASEFGQLDQTQPTE